MLFAVGLMMLAFFSKLVKQIYIGVTSLPSLFSRFVMKLSRAVANFVMWPFKSNSSSINIQDKSKGLQEKTDKELQDLLETDEAEVDKALLLEELSLEELKSSLVDKDWKITTAELERFFKSSYYLSLPCQQRSYYASLLAVTFSRKEEFPLVEVCLHSVKPLIEEDARIEIIYRLITTDRVIDNFPRLAKLAVHQFSDTETAQYNINKPVVMWDQKEVSHVRPPLIAYIAYRHPELLELFIENKAIYAKEDLYRGASLYALAAMNGSVSILQYFREKGLEKRFINLATDHGFYGPELVKDDGQSTNTDFVGGRTPLMWALLFGHHEVLLHICSALLPREVLEPTDKFNRNALHWAALVKDKKAVEYLLQIADAVSCRDWIKNSFDFYGHSPLDYATCPHSGIIYDLLDKVGFDKKPGIKKLGDSSQAEQLKPCDADPLGGINATVQARSTSNSGSESLELASEHEDLMALYDLQRDGSGSRAPSAQQSPREKLLFEEIASGASTQRSEPHDKDSEPVLYFNPLSQNTNRVGSKARQWYPGQSQQYIKSAPRGRAKNTADSRNTLSSEAQRKARQDEYIRECLSFSNKENSDNSQNKGGGTFLSFVSGLGQALSPPKKRKSQV